MQAKYNESIYMVKNYRKKKDHLLWQLHSFSFWCVGRLINMLGTRTL